MTETDILGWRAKFGVLGPSTNTVVQPEFDSMRPPGVTNHYSRIFTPNTQAVSDESFLAGTTLISAGLVDAVKSVLTCEPNYLVMGMSALTFYGGIEGSVRYKERITDLSGLGVSMGSEATAAALRAFSGVRRVAFLSPYFPVANAEVRRYLNEAGFEVVKDVCLRCSSWTAIARVPQDRLRQEIRSLAETDADAIVQVGTNLCMAELADELETVVGRPVIAINTATYWHALRAWGIPDKIAGFGRLLQEH
jgi:maleate isomerase